MMDAPFCIVTVVAMLPTPLGAPQAVITLPPDPGPITAQVHAPMVIPAGAVSVTVALVTSDGPLLVTTIEYVVESPALTLAAPLVLVIGRSAFGGVGCVVVPLFVGAVADVR